MPLIRFIYPRDIAREGSAPIEVSDERAAFLLNQRRAVIVEQQVKPTPRKQTRRKAK